MMEPILQPEKLAVLRTKSTEISLLCPYFKILSKEFTKDKMKENQPNETDEYSHEERKNERKTPKLKLSKRNQSIEIQQLNDHSSENEMKLENFRKCEKFEKSDNKNEICQFLQMKEFNETQKEILPSAETYSFQPSLFRY